jgi:polysaccharide export outer membrane protein
VKRNRIAVLLLAGCALSALAGCGSAPGPGVRHEAMVPFSPAERDLFLAAQGDFYRIQRGDLLGVFFIDKDLNQQLKQPEVLVLPDGSASFIGVDRLEVAGRTVVQLDSTLTARYGQSLRDVDLSVVVTKSAGIQVYVLGEVRNPDLYSVPAHGFTVMGAIARAGGFQDGADRGSVTLIRLTPEGYLCREMNLAAIRKGLAFDAALADLRSYDIIYVSRSALGDFAAFSRDVVQALSHYTGLVLDVRAIERGTVLYGR